MKWGDKKRNRGDKMVNSKIIAGLAVLGVIAFLLLSSPAAAYILGLKVSNEVVEKGKSVKLSADIDMEDGQLPSDINYIALKIKGPKDSAIYCRFLKNGIPISGCENIDIKVQGQGEYGYCGGYGYGNCKLKYKFELETTGLEVGNYLTVLVLVLENGKTVENPGENFTVFVPNKTCSVRAGKGNVNVKDKEFKNAKVSFFVPLKSARNGEGSLVSGTGRNRLSYNFKVEQIISNDMEELKLQVAGKYKIGMGPYINERAVLTLDKATNKIRISGKDIYGEDLRVSFKQNC